jgi:hypothetical protein
MTNKGGRGSRGEVRGGVPVGGDGEVELEAVVGETDVGWESGVGGFVVEVVGHVGEEGAARLELVD